MHSCLCYELTGYNYTGVRVLPYPPVARDELLIILAKKRHKLAIGLETEPEKGEGDARKRHLGASVLHEEFRLG